MLIDTTQRSNAPEIMDDFAMEGEILRDALDKIASINRLLGGNKVTLEGIEGLLGASPAKKAITVVDIGCGNGDMLRALSDYGTRNGIQFNLLGIDANAFTISHAQRLSESYENISYRCVDIFDDTREDEEWDIVLCTLTLHHFKDDEILKLMNKFYKQSRIGIVINDLHRSAAAYYLFKALCYAFGLNHMSREDGLVSILRGFKRKDLEKYSAALHLKDFRIRWRWAFRYQWIIRSV